MQEYWFKHLIGARTIKTGLAIFFTALFCMALGLTPIFAILTAVVTIEPTAKASFKKGYRRLPATVIGAFFAVIFTYLFGDESPLTYALSATFTIIFCTKLNLQVGTTVATLTSVAMIPGINDAYVFNFLSRTLTAIIGIVTAGLINFIIFPPKYYNQLEQRLTSTEQQMYELFYRRCRELILGKFHSETSIQQFTKISMLNDEVQTLIGYQRDELSYHKKQSDYSKLLNQMTRRAYTNRLFITHLSNLIYLPQHTALTFNSEEKLAILNISQNIKKIVNEGTFAREEEARSLLNNTIKALDIRGQQQIKSHLIYEFLMIYRLLDHRYA